MASIRVNNDPLAVIYNESQWRVNKISPMYNLLRNEVKLKQYSSKIRQSLMSNVATNYSTKLMVVLNDLPYLKYSEEDPNGLMITVTSTKEKCQSKVAYCAIFLSWGVRISLEGATHLPYMLERGDQAIGTVVKSTLQTIFDCNVNQFSFTQSQLLLFGFNFVEHDTSRATDPVTLTYKTQIDLKNTLKFTMEIGDIHSIWNRIKDKVDKESERVIVAYQSLQNQIYYMLELDITVAEILTVTLPKAEIKNIGVVRMKTPEIVNSFFTVLNEICSGHEMFSLCSDKYMESYS